MTPSEGSRGTPARWDLLLQVVGAGAAMAAWIAVVGGARVWARLHAADIPATQTLSVLPRRLLVVEGLQALLVPLVIAGGLALVVHFWRSSDVPANRRPPRLSPPGRYGTGKLGFGAWLVESFRESEPVRGVRRLEQRYTIQALAGMAALAALALLVLTLAIVRVNPWWIVGAGILGAALAFGVAVTPRAGDRTSRRWSTAAILIALAAPLIGAIVALGSVVRFGYLFVILLLTLAFVWMTLGALARLGSRGHAVGWTLFAALALWSGTVGFLRLAGAREPELEWATVERTKGETLEGFYLGGSGGDVYIATGNPRTVRLVPEEDVADLFVGEPREVPPSTPMKTTDGEDDGSDGSGPVSPDATDELSVLASSARLDEAPPLLLEVVGVHRGDKLLTLDLRLKNLADQKHGAQPFTVDDAFDDGVADGAGNVPDSLDGLRLTDQDGSLTYPVARDEEGRCVCTDDLRRVTIEAGESTLMTATFGRPQDDAALVMHASGFPTLDLDDEG